jgi:hypothetical protein
VYTGELINTLLESVEDAERKLFVKVSVARQATESQGQNTYMYDFGRTEHIGAA